MTHAKNTVRQYYNICDIIYKFGYLIFILFFISKVKIQINILIYMLY